MKMVIMISLMILFSSVMTAGAGGVIVIAHQDTPLSTLTTDEVQRIFLGKKTVWKNGRKIVPVCLRNGKSHETFLRSLMDMNGSQFEIFWRQAVFTGTGRMPKSFADEEDVVRFVSNTPGGMGYIDSETRHGMVKTISVK